MILCFGMAFGIWWKYVPIMERKDDMVLLCGMGMGVYVEGVQGCKKRYFEYLIVILVGGAETWRFWIHSTSLAWKSNGRWVWELWI